MTFLCTISPYRLHVNHFGDGFWLYAFVQLFAGAGPRPLQQDYEQKTTVACILFPGGMI